MLHLVTRILIALILVAILPVPIFIMHAISSNLLRVLCTFLAMLFLLAGISCLSDARTAEIFIAAATYVDFLTSGLVWEGLLTQTTLVMQPFSWCFWVAGYQLRDLVD
jgi:hypothetical protein